MRKISRNYDETDTLPLGDKVGYVGPFNRKIMRFGQPDQPRGFVRLSSLIERTEMNFNTYRPQRGKIKHRSHAVEDLALETFDINLDDCGDSMACGNDGVGTVLPHWDGGSSSTVRKMIARGRASGRHRQPRLAVLVRREPRQSPPTRRQRSYFGVFPRLLRRNPEKARRR